MNLQQYRKNKNQLEQNQNAPQVLARKFCSNCWQPNFNCFCHTIHSFDPKIEFIILIHPLESRRRIATGRMSYLCLENSYFIRGSEFSTNPTVERLLNDTDYNNMILSPGENSVDITNMSETEKIEKFTSSKKLRVFLIDGTWSNAGGMINKTPRLKELPRFCFTPNTPSNIRVRKQPSPMCYSTIEAIHHIIGLLGKSQGFNTQSGVHNNLLKPFNWMVEKQIERLKEKRAWRHLSK